MRFQPEWCGSMRIGDRKEFDEWIQLKGYLRSHNISKGCTKESAMVMWQKTSHLEKKTLEPA